MGHPDIGLFAVFDIQVNTGVHFNNRLPTSTKNAPTPKTLKTRF